MSSVFFEALESREMFSAPAIAVQAPTPMAHSAVTVMAKAALPSLAGRFSGTLLIPAVGHNKGVLLTITKQTAAGAFVGKLTSGNVSVNVTGKMSANRTFSISLVGSHQGGPISATGSGTLDAAGKKVSLRLTFRVGSQSTPGTATATKV